MHNLTKNNNALLKEKKPGTNRPHSPNEAIFRECAQLTLQSTFTL